MTIVSLEFEDRARGWKLLPTNFGSFNLLVGPSGSGKTSVLRALRSVCRAGTKNLDNAKNSIWSIRINDGSNGFIWHANTSNSTINEESIRVNGNNYIERIPNKNLFIVDGNKFPKLKLSESVISLLEDDETIKPIKNVLRNTILSYTIDFSKPIDNNNLGRRIDLDTLRQESNLSLETKAHLLIFNRPDIFYNIKNYFVEIFENISEISVGLLHKPIKETTLLISVVDSGNTIHNEYISSGMLRVFSILLELALAPKGAVILIDEIENSLGVNCLPQIIDAMLERSNEVQFIITSHHPYVINNIPYEYWRLVRRKGGEVWLQDAKDIPALKSLSSYHDRFLQLINAPEFEESMG